MKSSLFMSTEGNEEILSSRGGVRGLRTCMRCNLCGRRFQAPSKYYRFCRSCRDTDELFRFHDWLPGC